VSTSFGIHVESPTVVAAYLNGSFVGRYSVPSATGTHIAMAQAFNLTPGQPHVDRLEVRTAPGGTLLLAVGLAGYSARRRLRTGAVVTRDSPAVTQDDGTPGSPP